MKKYITTVVFSFAISFLFAQPQSFKRHLTFRLGDDDPTEKLRIEWYTIKAGIKGRRKAIKLC